MRSKGELSLPGFAFSQTSAIQNQPRTLYNVLLPAQSYRLGGASENQAASEEAPTLEVNPLDAGRWLSGLANSLQEH